MSDSNNDHRIGACLIWAVALLAAYNAATANGLAVAVVLAIIGLGVMCDPKGK